MNCHAVVFHQVRGYRQCSFQQAEGSDFCKRHLDKQKYGRIHCFFKNEEDLIQWQCHLISLEHKILNSKLWKRWVISMRDYLDRTYREWHGTKTMQYYLTVKTDCLISSMIQLVKGNKATNRHSFETDGGTEGAVEGVEDAEEDTEEEEDPMRCNICMHRRHRLMKMPCCNYSMCYRCWTPVCYSTGFRCPYCRSQVETITNLIGGEYRNNIDGNQERVVWP